MWMGWGLVSRISHLERHPPFHYPRFPRHPEADHPRPHWQIGMGG